MTSYHQAPEVLQKHPYSTGCDLWSVGTIMYEMLFGRPPFAADDDKETLRYDLPQRTLECMMILLHRDLLNWRETLQFPDEPAVSDEAIDLIMKLCCDAEDRLTVPQIKEHPFLKVGYNTTRGRVSCTDAIHSQGIDWDHVRDRTAPFVPVLENELDIRNFDEEIIAPVREPKTEEQRPSVRKVVTGTHWAFTPPLEPNSCPTIAQDLPWIGYSYRGFEAASKLVALEEDLVARQMAKKKK